MFDRNSQLRAYAFLHDKPPTTWQEMVRQNCDRDVDPCLYRVHSRNVLSILIASVSVITLAVILLISSCTTPQPPPTPAAVSTNTAQANMPNPASAFCVQQGFRSEIRTAADGSQSGVCIFPDGSECDEWAYYRGECGFTPSGTPILPTPSAEVVVNPETNLIPAGVIIDPRNGSLDMTKSLIFYNPDGLILGELLATGAGQVHVAGHYEGSLSIPVVFLTYETESQHQSLSVNSGSTPTAPGGQISVLTSLEKNEMVSGLVGVPGEPTVFYVVFQPLDSTLQSRFVITGIDANVNTSPVLTLESDESSYWIPVAIEIHAGSPNRLWFTRSPWGIGGEIVFHYYEGLGFLDLSSGAITEVLPPETRFNSLSKDHTWVVYSVRTDTDNGFFIRQVAGGDPLAIPLLPESNRGAGDGIFSPSNQHIAWREAQGSFSEGNFYQTIRVATLDGKIIGEFKDASFYKAAELTERGTAVEPVGWLNDENLLVQVTEAEKPHAKTVVKLNVTNGELALFAKGFFVGFFYP